MRNEKNETIQDASVADADVQNQFETFKSYFRGPNPKEESGTLIYRAKSGKDSKVMLGKALNYITSLGLPLMAAPGPDNTVVIKQFRLFFNSKF